MILLNLLVKPIWIFLIDRNVQLTVGHQEYGLYSALLSLSLIFSIALDFGITNYNNRNIASDNSQIHFTLPNMIAAKILFSLFYFLLIFLIALIFNYSGRALYLLLLLGGVQFLNSFLQFLRSNVSANHDFKIDSALSVLDKVVMIIICGFLLILDDTKSRFIIEWYLYAQLFAYTISILVAIFVVVLRYARIDFQHFSWIEMKSFCIKSLPYALLILLMGIYMRSDSLLLERLEGAEINSIYAEAYRILDALNMFGFLLAGILLPMFTRLIAKKININEIVRVSANIIISISLCIVSHSLIYNHDIMLFLDKNAASNLPMIYVLVISSFPFYCAIYIYSTLLTANGDIILLIKIACLGCFFSLGLNLLMIPSLHAIGAGISALVVQALMASISIYFCWKKFHLSLDVSWIMKFILLFSGFLLLNFLFKYLSIPLLPSVLINIPFFVMFVYLVKLWDKDTILNYLKQYKSTD
jgi:O-antigen/teichoic acid export membrane protein